MLSHTGTVTGVFDAPTAVVGRLGEGGEVVLAVPNRPVGG
jgi:hypothetical protein